MPHSDQTQCPCGSAQHFTECCQPFLAHRALPNTPEQLMRSRYTAYVLADIAYIASTQAGAAAKHFSRGAARRWAKSVEWLRLEVIDSESDPLTGLGRVRFIAYYREDGRERALRENSVFRLVDGKWFYTEGSSD